MLPALDPTIIIDALGYTGIFCILFAESSLFFAFFLPGDSLLFTAGLLASEQVLNIWVLLIIAPVASVLGNSTGYWFGAWLGPRLFTKEDSFFFNKKYIERSEMFYQKYGPRAIVLARFVPVVRTFIPILAGVARMRYSTFLIYNIIGSILWGAGVALLGYTLGRAFPQTEHYLTAIIIFIIAASVVPVAIEWWRKR